eukprot:TRINITY_DN1160_c0_g1_i2.p1 TRINITY_DN1160_c0_g1~~TRINITY_DN1160_c0_g1_i2.p1  ORF type:complete len:182 (-),score=38.48 TRINITY_DN1160_c0_g1_i2:201-746(-)
MDKEIELLESSFAAPLELWKNVEFFTKDSANMISSSSKTLDKLMEKGRGLENEVETALKKHEMAVTETKLAEEKSTKIGDKLKQTQQHISISNNQRSDFEKTLTKATRDLAKAKRDLTKKEEDIRNSEIEKTLNKFISMDFNMKKRDKNKTVLDLIFSFPKRKCTLEFDYGEYDGELWTVI